MIGYFKKVASSILEPRKKDPFLLFYRANKALEKGKIGKLAEYADEICDLIWGDRRLNYLLEPLPSFAEFIEQEKSLLPTAIKIFTLVAGKASNNKDLNKRAIEGLLRCAEKTDDIYEKINTRLYAAYCAEKVLESNNSIITEREEISRALNILSELPPNRKVESLFREVHTLCWLGGYEDIKKRVIEEARKKGYELERGFIELGRRKSSPPSPKTT